MKYLAIIFLLFARTSAHCQSANVFAAWAPNGWKTLSAATGDLNRDGVDDAALVVEEINSVNLRTNKARLGAEIFNLNPRRLIVLINTSNGYKQIFSRDNLLPTEHDEGDPCLVDPLADGWISISHGTLIIKLQYWQSCGGWGSINNKFTFRLDNNRFRLTGFDSFDYYRNTGEEFQVSINYLTGKKKNTTVSNIADTSRRSESWKTIPSIHKFYLDDILLDCNPKNKSASWRY